MNLFLILVIVIGGLFFFLEIYKMLRKEYKQELKSIYKGVKKLK